MLVTKTLPHNSALPKSPDNISQAPLDGNFWSICRAIGASALEADLLAWGGEMGKAREPVKALYSGRWWSDEWVKRCLGAVARRRLSLDPAWLAVAEAYPDWDAFRSIATGTAAKDAGDAPNVPMVQGADRATIAVLVHEKIVTQEQADVMREAAKK